MTEPKTLYVNRPVKNADEIIAWAKAVGFKTTLLPEDMHVTVAYSKAPLEWPKPRKDSISCGHGERTIEQLGGGATVLTFESSRLQKRWEKFLEAGATWDHPEYRPHVTLSYDVEGVDLSSIKPFDGMIDLGPERFAEVESGWADKIVEKGMPYDKNDDLPESVRNALPAEAQTLYRRVVNRYLADGAEESKANVAAWATVKNGWHKQDGRWFKKSADDDTIGEVTIAKVDKGLGLVFGWAIICKVDGNEYFDVQDEHVPEDAMLTAAAEFMENSRVAKDMHDGDSIGPIVFAWPMTEELAKSLDISTKKTGLLIAMKPSKEVLEKFESGDYAGFSIGGRRLKSEDAT